MFMYIYIIDRFTDIYIYIYVDRYIYTYIDIYIYTFINHCINPYITPSEYCTQYAPLLRSERRSLAVRFYTQAGLSLGDL